MNKEWILADKWLVSENQGRRYSNFNFMETRNRVNNHNTWNKYRDKKIPIKLVEIKPEKGYQIVDVIIPWNEESHYLIKHPAGLLFRVSCSSCINIIKSSTIINGEIQGKLVGSPYGLFTEIQYRDKKQAVLNIQQRLKNTKITPSNLISNSYYQDSNGLTLFYHCKSNNENLGWGNNKTSKLLVSFVNNHKTLSLNEIVETMSVQSLYECEQLNLKLPKFQIYVSKERYNRKKQEFNINDFN